MKTQFDTLPHNSRREEIIIESQQRYSNSSVAGVMTKLTTVSAWCLELDQPPFSVTYL